MPTLNQINRTENKISIIGKLGMGEFHKLLGVIYETTQRRGYSEIIMDFSECEAAFNGPMLCLCSQFLTLTENGISIDLVLPKNDKLCKIFLNSNWPYLIQPNKYNKSAFRGFTQVPATIFADQREQSNSVEKIINAILCSMSGLKRGDLAAIEWSINEITDNVLVHSNSNHGGFVQLTTYKSPNPRIEYVVCDSGIGIPASLKPAYPHIESDIDALDQAIREGVTNGLGMGNGLFGSFEVSRISGGYFQIHSGNAKLSYDQKAKLLHMRNEPVPYTGTLIVACIECSKTGVLEEALKFGGIKHTPIDMIELKYEMESDDQILFALSHETLSFGTRLAGVPIRNKLLNLHKMCNQKIISIDFTSIPVLSSSFADEVFGKIFLEIGADEFRKCFRLYNMNDTVKGLVFRALNQRGYPSPSL